MGSIEVSVVDSGWTIFQAVGTCLGAIGAVFALIYFAKQTRSMAESFQFDYKWRRKNKSSELALFYAQSILPRIGYCSSIIKRTDIYPLLKSLDPKQMIRFNRAELEKAFDKDQDIFSAVKESVAKVDLKVFMRTRRSIPVSFRYEFAEQLSMMKAYTSDPKMLHTVFEKEFWMITESVLNDLEYFSMCINSRIADGDVLYPSLHQTFFSMISVFYFFIAYQNTNMKDKYYTHIIRLFKAWKERLIEHERRECQAEESMSQEYSQIS